MIELAERLAELSSIPEAKVFFTTSGTEANEAALLLASTARRSNQVLALRNSYHGRSFATMGITGNRGWSASSLTPFVRAATSTAATGSAPCSATCPTTTSSPPGRRPCASCSPRAPRRRRRASSPSPSRAWVGSPCRPTASSGRSRRCCDEHGILYISDEVQTGWGTHRRPLLGLPGPRRRARHDHLRQGARQRAPRWPGSSPAATSWTPSAAARSPRSAATRWCAAGALANLDYLLDHELQANAATVGSRILRSCADGAGALGVGRRHPRQGAHDRRRARGARTGARPHPRPPARSSSRPAQRGCSSARAASTATASGSPRRCP